VLQDCVQRGHRRDPECPDEVKNVCAVLAAPDPVFVLDRDNADALAQGLRRPKVVGRLVDPDPMVDLDRIRRRGLRRLMKGHDLPVAGIGREVAGEGGDPASSWWIR
jgi:hypothetical protein